MFSELIVQPLFNVLTLIYALIPGNNFGLAIILFTILIRFALLPLTKKQLRNSKAMRDLQPEIKEIKKKTKGNRQQESLMMMELYREREVKPLSTIGTLVIQIVIFLTLFAGLNRVVNNPQEIYNYSYGPIQNLSHMQEVNADISNFDNTLVGVIDLDRSASSGDEGFYFLAFLLVVGSAVTQFFQMRQLTPRDKDSRKLREILADASAKGEPADNAEVNAAMQKNMMFFLPAIIFVVSIGFPAAITLYWFVSGLVGFIQQSILLKQEEYSMTGPTASVVSKKPLKDSGVKVTTRRAGSTKKTTTKKAKTTKKSASKKKKG